MTHRLTPREPKRRPPVIWSQSRHGRVIDLVEPRAADVDFHEMALTLAFIPRFNACFEKPISVAQHLLIAALAAPAELRPWVLLHDAHEAVLGDSITPVVTALDALYRRRWTYPEHIPLNDEQRVRHFAPSAILAELKHRHDIAIHVAAGLPMPDEAQRAAIHEADRRALVTERRDFLARPPLSWGTAIENTPPLTQRFRLRPPLEVADALMAAWCETLPALRIADRIGSQRDRTP
jgi:hypothetical protein